MPAAASQPPIDADLLVVHTGQTYIKTVAAAVAALDAANADLGHAIAACRKGALPLAVARVRFWAARWGTHPALDATMLSSLLGMGSALVTIFVFHAGYPVALGLLLFAYLCVSLPLAALTWDRAGETDANRRQVRSDWVRQLLADADRTRALARMAAASRDRAARLVPAVTRAADAMRARQWEAYQAELAAQQALAQAQLQASRTYQLSCVNVDVLSGADFENFLAEVFINLGYGVTHTGRTGDQGVDLIARDASDAVAIQAKRYNGSVGNGAVQEVYTGMRFHACSRCVVVTNSHFTRAARRLAATVGCTLVGRAELPLLIRGHLRV